MKYQAYIQLYNKVIECHKNGHDNLPIAEALKVSSSEVSLIIQYWYSTLTRDEQKIVRLALKGVTRKEIARLLNKSRTEVHNKLKALKVPIKRKRKTLEDIKNV